MVDVEAIMLPSNPSILSSSLISSRSHHLAYALFFGVSQVNYYQTFLNKLQGIDCYLLLLYITIYSS